MKLKTRIVLGFTMIILMPLLLFAATLYGFSQSQAQKAQAVTESDGTVYDISITDSADSQGRVHVMAKDLFISSLFSFSIRLFSSVDSFRRRRISSKS